MKNLKKIVLSFIICIFAFTAIGCFSVGAEITIVDMPKSVFTKNEVISTTKLMKILVDDGGVKTTIELTYNPETNVVTVDNAAFTGQILIKNFSLDEIGSRTASVTYGEAISYFDYQVIDSTSIFAGGDGSVNNPFQITTLVQLKAISGSYNYKLMNDIDLSSERSEFVITNNFSGTLDGNNKKLYNYQTGLADSFLFKNVVSGVKLMNYNIYVNDTENSMICTAIGNVLIENVNIYGTLVGTTNNVGPFCTYARNVQMKLKNCNNYVDIFTTSYHCSAFIGLPMGVCNISFEDCANYGHLEGEQMGVLFGNAYADGTNVTYSLKNVKNYGSVLTTKNNENGLIRGAGSMPTNPSASSETLANLATYTIASAVGFTTLAEVSAENQIIIKAVGETSTITRIIIELQMPYMRTKNSDGTLSQALKHEYTISDKTASIPTEFFAAEVIEVATSNKWLKYDSTLRKYVFNGEADDPALFGEQYNKTDIIVKLYVYDVDGLVSVSTPVKLSSLIK